LFPLPYQAPLAHLLYALFAAVPFLLGGGLLLGKMNAEQTGRLPRPLRMLLSALLLLAAFLQWKYGAGPGAMRVCSRLVLLGMAASFAGDLIMARLVPVPKRLIFGMAAFALGHVFYVSAFAHLLLNLPPVGAGVTGTVIAAVLAFGVWAWHRFVRDPDRSKVINIGSLLYGLLLGLSASLAILLAFADSHYVGLAAGGLLFLLSDLVLGNWVIRGHVWRSVNDVIWLTYVVGQLLIVYSVAATIHVWR
jgi:hypothetical protein